jgi:hypothetical protein
MGAPAWLLLFAMAFASQKPPATGAAHNERGLCDGWVWPPTGTRFCDSDAACAEAGSGFDEDLTCGGCMPSSCSCNPATGGALSCTRDCLAYCRDAQGNMAPRMHEEP